MFKIKKTERETEFFRLSIQKSKIDRIEKISNETGFKKNEIILMMIDNCLDDLEKKRQKTKQPDSHPAVDGFESN